MGRLRRSQDAAQAIVQAAAWRQRSSELDLGVVQGFGL